MIFDKIKDIIIEQLQVDENTPSDDMVPVPNDMPVEDDVIPKDEDAEDHDVYEEGGASDGT